MSRYDNIGEDAGAPEDTVYYLPKTWPKQGVKNPSKGTHYHDKKTCHTIQGREEKLRETTRENAKERWLDPCSVCVLNRKQRGEVDDTKYDDDLLNDLSDN